MKSTRATTGAPDALRAPLRIGNVELADPVLSAPIAGFTDHVFRGIVREFGGAGIIYTEMVSAGGWVLGDEERPKRLAGIDDEPRPLGVQLWDRDPKFVEEAARRVADLGVSIIDLNFGCPKKRIMGKQGAGATLLRDPRTAATMVEHAKRGAGDVPVTIKIRLGACAENPTAPEVARSAESAGVAAITVHGRTADEGYGTPSRAEQIREVVESVDVPVIANGDIDGAPKALEVLEKTGADGVMVARAAMQKPWVFREISCALRGDAVPAPPTPADQKDQLIRHFERTVDFAGVDWGMARMRKFAGQYCPGIPGAREFRARISKARTPEQFLAVVESWFPA